MATTPMRHSRASPRCPRTATANSGTSRRPSLTAGGPAGEWRIRRMWRRRPRSSKRHLRPLTEELHQADRTIGDAPKAHGASMDDAAGLRAARRRSVLRSINRGWSAQRAAHAAPRRGPERLRVNRAMYLQRRPEGPTEQEKATWLKTMHRSTSMWRRTATQLLPSRTGTG